MKDKLLGFWQNHKKTIIQVSGAVVGAVLGVGIVYLLTIPQDEIIDTEFFDEGDVVA